MLGKLLEGAAWFATLSLATAGGLTFVPDGAWETFPTALRPARAKLAEFGVAPTRYRVDANAENGGVLAANQGATQAPAAGAGKDGKGDRIGGDRAEDAWNASTHIRIGERWKRVREVEKTSGLDGGGLFGATAFATDNRSRELGGTPDAFSSSAATVEPVEAEKTVDAVEDLALLNAAPGVDATIASEPASALGGEGSGDDAIPPFVAEVGGVGTDVAPVENAPAFPVVEDLSAPADVADASAGVGPSTEGTAETGGIAPVAPVADAAIGNDFNGGAGFNAPANLLEQADAALANDLNASSPVAPAAPVDEAAELRDALAAASVASTPEEIKTVFETLNKIRDERGRRLAVEDAQALDAALDRLAFDVFYNPAQSILEPRWQTAPGESLAAIAERLGTTPETLAEINGLKTPVDAPLPVGTTLKTVRGPVSAEISIAKKELTLRFNGLYAGRFALGVPESSANLRGDFRVVEKLANPNCDAVDANGQTIAIPGGAPENPLGSAWIALDGGVGLQGTNRPELVGQTISENGGFVFSNREISQLSVLLPVGAVVKIVD